MLPDGGERMGTRQDSAIYLAGETLEYAQAVFSTLQFEHLQKCLDKCENSLSVLYSSFLSDGKNGRKSKFQALKEDIDNLHEYWQELFTKCSPNAPERKGNIVPPALNTTTHNIKSKIDIRADRPQTEPANITWRRIPSYHGEVSGSINGFNVLHISNSNFAYIVFSTETSHGDVNVNLGSGSRECLYELGCSFLPVCSPLQPGILKILQADIASKFQYHDNRATCGDQMELTPGYNRCVLWLQKIEAETPSEKCHRHDINIQVSKFDPTTGILKYQSTIFYPAKKEQKINIKQFGFQGLVFNFENSNIRAANHRVYIDSPLNARNMRIQFERPCDGVSPRPIKVMVGFSYIWLECPDGFARIRMCTSMVDKEGFNLHIRTWGGNVLRGAAVSYVALQQ